MMVQHPSQQRFKPADRSVIVPKVWFRMIGKPVGAFRRLEQRRIVPVDLTNIDSVIVHRVQPRLKNKALRFG
jgi:hypothetical protein